MSENAHGCRAGVITIRQRWMIIGKPGKGENIKYVTSVAFEPCQNAKYQSKANFLIIDNDGVRHERFDVWSPVVDIKCA